MKKIFIMFFLLLPTQICYTQWVQANNSNHFSRYHHLYQKNKYIPIQSDHKSNAEINKTLTDTLWVRHYGSQLVPSFDCANAIATDNSGNIYITGFSLSTGTSADFITIKYSSSGNEEWSARYNGEGNDWDEAVAITVDLAENVYVSGFSTRTGTGQDYTTIKYNSSGNQEWIAHYNGEGNSSDFANAIIVDNEGNVCVTGSSGKLENEPDFATIKYDLNGNEKWVVRYNGPANHTDEATALAADNQGNIYVTGGSEGTVTGRDITTIKYNNLGSQQWIARHNGPDNNYDEASALVLDNSGNVYVTGVSGLHGWYTYVGNYCTIKYTIDGNEEWVKYYNGPSNGNDLATAIAIDYSGNIFVTGGSEGLNSSADFATIKYSPNGNQEWVVRYNSTRPPGYSTDPKTRDTYDRANSIAVDMTGSIYVTGGSGGDGYENWEQYSTLKYNSAGEEEWLVTYNGSGNAFNCSNAMVVDVYGDVYIAGHSGINNSSTDCATVKYNPSGIQVCVYNYDGPANSIDEVADMVVDTQGSAYLTGTSVGLTGTTDIVTIKYSSSGSMQWTARYDGPANGSDRAAAIAIDNNGNVFVTGESEGIGTSKDYVIIKYSSFGVQEWVARYNGPGNSNDLATAITVDRGGNVYVTGGSGGTTDEDYAVIKYSGNGNLEWVVRYGQPYSWCCNERSTSIAVDTSGNVYVSGYSDQLGDIAGYATIKFNSSGQTLWIKHYDGGFMWTKASIAVDIWGNVYLTGTQYGTDHPSYVYHRYVTIKYNPHGQEQWINYYGNPYLVGSPTAIAVDTSGNIYITGNSCIFTPSGSGYDYATIKYDQNGNEEWVARYDNGDDGAEDIALDIAGNIYVTGISNGSFTTIKYSPFGNQEWLIRYDGPGITLDKAVAVGLSGYGQTENVFVTGNSSSQGWSSITTIKYDQTITSAEEERGTIPSEFFLSQNYPNPFNPSTKISWQSPVGIHQTIKVFDLLGNEIATLVDEYKPAGRYEVNFNAAHLPSGVYFCKMMAGGYINTKKMILVK